MAAKTPKIQLVFNLRGDEPVERIKKVTKSYEVVEIDGFTFKRRRTGAPRPAENEGPNASQGGALLKTPHGQRALQGLAAAAQSPGVDVCDLSRELYQRLSAGLAALPEAAPASQHLATFADSVCGAEVDRAVNAGHPAAAEALAEVFAAFRVSLAAALAEGRVSCALRAPGAGGGATPQGGCGEEEVDQAGPGYQVDLAVRKAGLRARLANFAKEEAEWQSLLQKVEQLDVAEGEAAAAAGTAEGEAEDAPEGAPLPAEVLALQQMQKTIHRQLSMQVDGVCKLVADVEELVGAANSRAGALQAEYHADKFRTFPHVDSPQRLIRELIRAPRAAAAAAPAAEAAPEAGAEAASPAAVPE